MSYLLVLTTVATLKEARKLSKLLLQKHLAACIQISRPIESHYWWKGKMQTARELQLWIKTKSTAYSKLEKVIRENHSYSVPEIIALPISKGNPDYFKWLAGEIQA